MCYNHRRNKSAANLFGWGDDNVRDKVFDNVKLVMSLKVVSCVKIAVLCISDSGFAGEREDASGPLIIEMMKGLAQTVHYKCLPDEQEVIAAELVGICDETEPQNRVDIILTTGGTGLAPRDVTPEATQAVAERLVPGIAEAMRQKSLTITDKAMLSRAVAGVRGKTLIINLPGSPKAVKENLETVMPVLEHAVELIRGRVKNCATTS
ncbi:MAG TPA: MogA/MoaB family molybdenum cofactor biosynthesis protein [Clostridia bacterium]|nr:MogA/MoaB family molybdenum cofactor biosynthesis protein [Clostridia bacterium]